MKNNFVRKIYLVRHARPNIAPHIYYGGRMDLPLHEDGIVCAKKMAQELKISPDLLYSSTMLRAKQTLEILFPERKSEFRIAENMHEICMGEWEGKTFDEVMDQWKDTFEIPGVEFIDCRCPGGESFREVQKRAVESFEKILEETEGDILFVLHGGILWTLICHYFDFNMNNIFYYLTDYCGLHELELNHGFMKLIRYNWCHSLV